MGIGECVAADRSSSRTARAPFAYKNIYFVLSRLVFYRRRVFLCKIDSRFLKSQEVHTRTTVKKWTCAQSDNTNVLTQCAVFLFKNHRCPWPWGWHLHLQVCTMFSMYTRLLVFTQVSGSETARSPQRVLTTTNLCQ